MEAVEQAGKAKLVVTVWDLMIWAYRDQKVHIVTDDRTRLGYGTKSVTGAVCDRLALGTKIDGCGPFGASLRCHPDADRVHDALLAAHQRADWMTGADVRDIISAAELGQPPSLDVVFVPSRVEPVIVRNRKGRVSPQMLYDENGKEIACEVTISGMTPDQVVSIVSQKRAVYRRFVRVLEGVRQVLKTIELEGRNAQGLGVHREPWTAADRRIAGRIEALVE